eukprot:scaffold317250_cov50-Prasinocladus_malaysianus.AAC.1
MSVVASTSTGSRLTRTRTLLGTRTPYGIPLSNSYYGASTGTNAASRGPAVGRTCLRKAGSNFLTKSDSHKRSACEPFKVERLVFSRPFFRVCCRTHCISNSHDERITGNDITHLPEITFETTSHRDRPAHWTVRTTSKNLGANFVNDMKCISNCNADDDFAVNLLGVGTAADFVSASQSSRRAQHHPNGRRDAKSPWAHLWQNRCKLSVGGACRVTWMGLNRHSLTIPR